MLAISGLDLADFFPATGFGRVKNGFANVLRFQGIAEIGAEGTFLARTVAFHEVSELIDEGMFVANVEARYPPLVHVWVLASVVGDMDRAPTACLWIFLVVLEVLQSVKVMQVPEERAIRSVYLEGVESLVSPGVAGGLEDG